MNAPPPSTPFPDCPRDTQDRLVIAHQGALGDFLLGLPLFDGLARLFIHRRIDFWGRPELLALLTTKSYLGQIRSSDSSELAAFFHDVLWGQTKIPAFFAEATAVFIIGQEQSRILAERFRHRLNVPVTWIRSFPSEDTSIAVGEYLVSQARSAGWPVAYGFPHLLPRDDEVYSVRAWFHRQGWTHQRAPVLIHPGSGGRAKIWPLQRWWHLIWWLTQTAGVPLLVLVGPADQFAWPLAESASILGAHVVTEVSLPRLAAILSQCRLFVGNDSGVSHLAAAIGIPTVALFGPTKPEVWAPHGPHVQVIKSHWQPSGAPSFQPGLAPEAVEPTVLRAVRRVLSV